MTFSSRDSVGAGPGFKTNISPRFMVTSFKNRYTHKENVKKLDFWTNNKNLTGLLVERATEFEWSGIGIISR